MVSINPSDYFNETYLRGYFKRKLLKKNGGGRDNLSPEKFLTRYGGEFSQICKKCLDGSYRFSYYNEKLVLKGSNKYPRVLSIPTIRDRMVLGVLNDYLSAVFPDCVSHEVPNSLIYKIENYINTHAGDPIYFLRTDFHNFYGTIYIKLLMGKISTRVSDDNIKNLINKAITTPTVSGSISKDIKQKKQGIPQGLAISNILASIYIHSFDEEFGRTSAGLYIRYVDDILFLDTKGIILKRQMLKEIQKRNLRLRLSPEKCKSGIVGETSIDFIGYVIKDKVFIRQRNVTRFINRVASLATKYKEGWENPNKRQLFIMKDSTYLEYYSEEFRELMSGFKYDNRLYGWMAYFQAITDVSSLYGMDRVIKSRILKDLPPEIKDKLHTLVETYYDIRRNGGKNIVPDYDALVTVGERESFLRKRGRIDANKHYTEEQINNYFESYIDFLKRVSEHHIGERS